MSVLRRHAWLLLCLFLADSANLLANERPSNPEEIESAQQLIGEFASSLKHNCSRLYPQSPERHLLTKSTYSL